MNKSFEDMSANEQAEYKDELMKAIDRHKSVLRLLENPDFKAVFGVEAMTKEVMKQIPYLVSPNAELATYSKQRLEFFSSMQILFQEIYAVSNQAQNNLNTISGE